MYTLLLLICITILLCSQIHDLQGKLDCEGTGSAKDRVAVMDTQLKFVEEELPEVSYVIINYLTNTPFHLSFHLFSSLPLSLFLSFSP